ncbi:MAG: glycosyltransferase family 2 protein, partial [Rhodococcus sp. (in: high G+C Gram-positive bacteria)]
MLPIVNEAENLPRVLPQLPARHELIVVDGGSADGSEAIVRRLRPDAVFIQQTRWGKGNALVCGFEASTGDIIVMFDGDGSANPREIDLFVSALTLGADFAKGTRYQAGGGSEDITALRGLGNRALTLFANRILGTRYSDLCYGYNAFWRDILPVLDLPPSLPSDGVLRWGDGFEIETVINCRISNAGFVVREVPSVE